MELMKFIRVTNTCLIIADYQFYAPLTETIDNWCYKTYKYHPRQGLVLNFSNEKDMTFFLLQWE